MISKESADWPELRDWLEEQIEVHRKLLETPGITHEMANVERGWIAAYRHILDTVLPARKPTKAPVKQTYNN